MAARILALVSDEINVRVSTIGYDLASFQNFAPIINIPAREIKENDEGTFDIIFDTKVLKTKPGNMKPIFEVVEE